MRYSSKLDVFLLVCSVIFGSLNGIFGPFVLIVNLKLVGSLLVAQVEYETTGINMDKFTHLLIEACLEYFAIAVFMFVAGFIAVSF